MTFKENKDAIYLFVFSLLGVVLAFLSISVNFVQRLYHAFGSFVPERAIEFFFNFAFLFLVGLIFFYYRKWRVSEAARKELDDVVASVNPDVFLVIDQERRIRMCNAAVSRMFGFSTDDVVGQKTDILYKDRRTIDPHGREVYEALEREGFHVGLATGVRKDGTELPIEIITAVLRTRKGAVLLLRDVTDRKKAEEKVLRVRDFYRSLFDEFPTPIRFSNAAGEGITFNKEWVKFTGRTADKERGALWTEGVYPDDRPRLNQQIAEAVRDNKAYEAVYRIRRHDGEYRWFIEYTRPFVDVEGSQSGFLSSCYDITERIVQERLLSYMATHDPLTDLPNRVLCLDRLKQAVADADRAKRFVAVMFVDVDNFKDVNDRFGHEMGDILLKGIAERLSGCTRLGDTVARFGGDEFIIVLPSLKEEVYAAAVAHRVFDSFSQPFMIKGNEIFITASFGISLYPSDSRNVETLLTLADKAMYAAKEGGRNSGRFADDRLSNLLKVKAGRSGG